MDADEALRFVEQLLQEQGKQLNDLQRDVFRESWQGKGYKEIHQRYPSCSLDHLMRNVGPNLWKLLTEVLGTKVSKLSLKGPIERTWKQQSELFLTLDSPAAEQPGDRLQRSPDPVSGTVSPLPLRTQPLIEPSTEQEPDSIEASRWSLGGAPAAREQRDGNQFAGNQFAGNQLVGDQFIGNQFVGGQLVGDQSVGDQLAGDQFIGHQSAGDQSVGDYLGGDQSVGDQLVRDQSVGDQSVGDHSYSAGDQWSGNSGTGESGSDPRSPDPSNSARSQRSAHGRPFITNWGTAPALSLFCGRSQELERLEEWITLDGCRLISILGLGGIGKTALSVELAQRLQHQFDIVIWRSLSNWQFSGHPPSVTTLLSDLVQVLRLSPSSLAMMPMESPDLGTDWAQLQHYLMHYHCLIVLDRVDALLQAGVDDGSYGTGYESYSLLFNQLGETEHQSCIVLTSREKPREIALLEGETQPTRSWLLKGLGEWEGQSLLQAKNIVVDRESPYGSLIRRYDGNPLALNTVATVINDLFAGNVNQFLETHPHPVIYNEIRDLFAEQLQRLSTVEQQIIHCLTESRSTITITHIFDTLSPSIPSVRLQEGLQSLRRRSLLTIDAESCSLPPLLAEYLIDSPLYLAE